MSLSKEVIVEMAVIMRSAHPIAQPLSYREIGHPSMFIRPATFLKIGSHKAPEKEDRFGTRMDTDKNFIPHRAVVELPERFSIRV